MISWGIIGCGNVTEVKSGPAFQKAEGSKLQAVMRRNGDLAKDYAKRHNVPVWYSDADKLIHDPEVNAVYIATPPDSHAELSIRAMQAGKPAYVEKPMALNYTECVSMIEASEKYGVPLFVAYYCRALPGFLKVKELVEQGVIGEIRTVNIQLYKSAGEGEKGSMKPWRVKPEVAGGGHFVDLASHQLDYLDYLLGPASKVHSIVLNQGNYYEAEDLVSASFLFGENVVVTGSWCFTVPPGMERDQIEIIGSKGSINFSSFEFTPVQLTTEKGTVQFPFPRPDHVQLNLIQLMVNELNGTGVSPSTGISGSRTTHIMDQVLASYYK